MFNSVSSKRQLKKVKFQSRSTIESAIEKILGAESWFWGPVIGV